VLSSSSDEAEVLVTAESTLVADIPDEDDQDVLAASASDVEAADFRSPTSPPPRHDPESDVDRAPSPPPTTTAALAATTPTASAVITLAASAATIPASSEAPAPTETADPSGPARPVGHSLLEDSGSGSHPDRQFLPIVDQDPTGTTRAMSQADAIVAALVTKNRVILKVKIYLGIFGSK